MRIFTPSTSQSLAPTLHRFILISEDIRPTTHTLPNLLPIQESLKPSTSQLSCSRYDTHSNCQRSDVARQPSMRLRHITIHRKQFSYLVSISLVQFMTCCAGY